MLPTPAADKVDEMGDEPGDQPHGNPAPGRAGQSRAQGQQQKGAREQHTHQVSRRNAPAGPPVIGGQDDPLEQHQDEDQVDDPAASEKIGYLRLSISRQIIGVKISCMARSILPPGQTMVFGRDMKESCSMDSR